MRVVVVLLVVLSVSAGCGGHPLYQDAAIPTRPVDSYTATIDNGGVVSPASGSVSDGSLVSFTATPTAGFEVASYSVNGGPAVSVLSSTPNPAGGVPVHVSLPISQSSASVVFTTRPVRTHSAIN